MNNPYATLEYISRFERPSEELRSYLNEKSIANFSGVNSEYRAHYPVWSKTRRDQRVKELQKLESESFKILINSSNFPILGLKEKYCKVVDVESLSICPNSVIAPMKKSFFIGCAKIDWSDKNKNNEEESAIFLMDCTYPSEGLVQFKALEKSANSDAPKWFRDAMWCTDTKKQTLVTSRYERYCDMEANIVYVVTPTLQKIDGIHLDDDITRELITYNDKEGFIIGSYPEQVFFVCKENGDVAMERDSLQTDIFGEPLSLSKRFYGLPHLKQHVLGSTERKVQKRDYTKLKNGIVKITNQCLLQKKAGNTSWDPEVLKALGTYVPCLRGKHSYNSLSTNDYANIVVALALEHEDCNDVLHDSLINRTIWATIRGTNRQVNAINVERIKHTTLQTWWTKKEYQYETETMDAYGRDNFRRNIVPPRCESVIPSGTLTADTVSFTDNTKMTPAKLIAVIQKKAEENADLLASVVPAVQTIVYPPSLFES